MFYIRQHKLINKTCQIIQYLILNRADDLYFPLYFDTIKKAKAHIDTLVKGYKGVTNSYFIEEETSPFIAQWLKDNPSYEVVNGIIQRFTDPAKREESCKRYRQGRTDELINTARKAGKTVLIISPRGSELV